ncbi:peroxiredoxin family protein [Cellulomonas sp. ACRRI]|uniref:peroxiredoxin family protein n=1 Tax=Cellulomonas sp. ACRRI TaxID=2918188 RepID=UPI001EF21507|nr:peroxiredoxin family protein [Cellulomonas sp. ACRRI]MCG7284748.1 peroxiredoxin family protein [Cellulomonas sp. ACRRI]
MTSAKVARDRRAAAIARVREDQRRHDRRRKLIVSGASAFIVVLIAAVVTAALLSARVTTSSNLGPAPDFTLQTTDGNSVTLSDFRGSPVILYFSEGAGCGSCLQQMGEIEKDAAFADAGITVLPIVMNTAEQITADMKTYGVTTPFLLDDGTVSKEYDTLGTGMHQGLPGHSFVLVDADGERVWSGNYPSMWLAPEALLKEVQERLTD